MADPTSIFIVDNGAYTIKANYSSYNDPHGAFTQLYEEPRPAKKKPGKKSRKKSSAVQPQADEVPAPPPDDPYEPRVIYNCLARAKDRKTYLGSEIDSIPDHSNLLFRRPFEKGLLTSWAPEHAIFNGLFQDYNVNPSETSLLITEPPLNPPSLGENYDQMVFEEWEFASYARSCGKF
jgi:actin-related protein